MQSSAHRELFLAKRLSVMKYLSGLTLTQFFMHLLRVSRTPTQNRENYSTTTLLSRMNRAKQFPQGIISREAFISYEMLIRLTLTQFFMHLLRVFLTPTQKQLKLQYHLPKTSVSCNFSPSWLPRNNISCIKV